MELHGKVGLVTGAGVRIGRGLALALAERGVRVAVHYGQSKAKAEETQSLICELGGEAELFQADLRDTEAAMDLVRQVADRFGRLDLLVNSAAIFRPGGVADTTVANWDEHFAVNLKSPFFLATTFARQLGEKQAGQIINIGDWRVCRPGPDYLAYTLSKAGLMAMTKSLALALAPHIRVNAIAPGAILPPPGYDEEYLRQRGMKLPLARAGGVEEVVKALLYLTTAEFVTGEVLQVDGGEHL